MDKSVLKPGWRKVKFGEVVRLSKARCADPLAEGVERYVGLEHLEPGDLRIRSWGNVAEGTTFTSVFKPGQVLFGKRRAYQRKVAVADFSGVCSGDIYVLESRDANVLLPDLLPFICQTDAFFEHAVGTSAGSLSPRTNWSSLADFEFALPPISEQRRILVLMREIDETIESYIEALKKHETARLAVLDDLITDGGKELEIGWSSQCLGDVCDLVNGYGFKPQDWQEEGLPIIRIQNLNGSQQFNYFNGQVDKKFHVSAGDLLFAWAGVPGVSFGARIWQGTNAVLNQHIFRVVPKSGFNQQWLFEVLNHITPMIERRAHGFKTSLLHIKRSELIKMAVRVPPLEVQHQIEIVSKTMQQGRDSINERLQTLRTLRRTVMFGNGEHL
ncbi:restriction endonuclease subunit S [Methylomonas sp. MS20]|uniref:restriction endonuclease subunit S n=1 Tax=unclassified Methylomonas TaxID=2608980 RepID=UPI0028A4D763|nr:restriction endonuclease subunit S [Methylomonas sp. MV1]MDT4330722.1 restriction endonuclease subunit S [Methylomonas sp. MV1]MDT4332745.1 restriction endonuclease subunit S [Methylomonas sp. MV1]